MKRIHLPDLICLDHFGGNFSSFIDVIYEVFSKDFVQSKPTFRGQRLRLKVHPKYQERAYTFYHMTHTGADEENRIPELRRCERIGYAKPVIENCDEWDLKVWPQKRKNKNRICIWLERIGEPDYFVVLDVRQDYILPWTAFVAEYEHEKIKKRKEFNDYIKNQRPPGNKAPTVS